jgi:hypothetical protein
MSGHVERVAGRLLAVDWTEHYRRTPSRVALMREHLRRSAIFAGAVGAPTWRFADLAESLDPGIRTPEAVLAAVRVALADRTGGRARRSAEHMLRLAAARDGGARLPDLPDPFDPLLVMFERGGGFTTHGDGLVQVDLAGVPIGSQQQAAMIPALRSLDAEALDALDAAGAHG